MRSLTATLSKAFSLSVRGLDSRARTSLDTAAAPWHRGSRCDACDEVLPLPDALKFLTPRARHAHAVDSEKIQVELARLLDLLLATDFWIFTPTCWKRAPVLHRFLALRGIRTRIVFGVRREDRQALDGHAWLEAEGRPLLEAVAPDYTVTFSYPN